MQTESPQSPSVCSEGQYDAWYSRTPSQAEGERDETGERTATEQHPEVPRSEPSQAEGERGDDA
ncbi:hypothetical protein ACFWOX_36670 [Streptomyces sp. NPDC058467]|uniref:hypothetical protein n=1 Tax=Streptomyces sp. NPDC058467 TaxID=3346513 RepID=UPI00365D4963